MPGMEGLTQVEGGVVVEVVVEVAGKEEEENEMGGDEDSDN